MEEVILVNENDEVLGAAEKLLAHQTGQLHRAFSIFLYNNEGQMLLQKRADGKYHSAGLWTNACCSHPRPGEDTLAAANRRLEEELGIKTSLSFLFSFQYEAQLENNLTEHEFDHVFVGYTNDKPQVDSNEVSDYQYISTDRLVEDILTNPDCYTFWFKKIIEEVIQKTSKY